MSGDSKSKEPKPSSPEAPEKQQTTGRVDIRFEITVPEETPAPSTFYLIGNAVEVGNWEGSGLPLKAAGSQRFSCTVSLLIGTELEYKITRGSWAEVETSAYGHEIPNRSFSVTGKSTEKIHVDGWKDHHKKPPLPQSIEGKVELIEVPSRPLRRPRRIWVYTPPASAGKGPFPLLMALDGQNCFAWGRDIDSMPHSWKLDLTADRLISKREMAPVVIAAVANGPRRASEYTPWKDPFHHIGGEARKCLTAFRDEFMPAVAKQFPARVDEVGNGVAGSSLGGLFSFWALLQEPSVFTRGAVVSPSFLFGYKALVRFLKTRRLNPKLRLWMDVGNSEIVATASVFQELYTLSVRDVRDSLAGLGLAQGSRFHYEEIEHGGHTEADWAARSDRILKFLYPATPG